MNNNIYYSSPIDVFLSRHNTSNLFTLKGYKIENIHDPFEFRFKKMFGYIPKDSIMCSNGDIFCNVHR